MFKWKEPRVPPRHTWKTSFPTVALDSNFPQGWRIASLFAPGDWMTPCQVLGSRTNRLFPSPQLGNRTTLVLDINHQVAQARDSQSGRWLRETRQLKCMLSFASSSFLAHVVRGSHEGAKAKIFTLNPHSCHFNPNSTELVSLPSLAHQAI